MKRGPFMTEEELVEKHQSGEFSWLDYISHYSDDWCDEFEKFCMEQGFDTDDETAAEMFVDRKNEELENGEA